MTADLLFQDPRLVDFYDIDNGWTDDTRTCLKLAAGVATVLDMGCGTGLLATALAERGADVVGVDPAAAMLDVARKRPGAQRVTWVEGDSRSVRLGRRFDFITMTGHAFQCLLSDADQLACLRTFAAHLAPGGRVIFDSRNPARREWEEWSPAESRRFVEHPAYGRVESWNDYQFDAASGIVTYGTYYRLPDGELLQAKSQIRFSPRDHLAALLQEAGLQVDRWLGDWQGNDYTPDAKEIIPLARLP